MRTIVSHKLGGRFISAIPVGGGGSNSGMWRIRAVFHGETGGRGKSGEEREVIVTLSKARGSPASYELDCEGLERRHLVPPEFWTAYRRHQDVYPAYADTRELFQLFFLLAGSRGLYRPHHPDPAKQEQDIQRYAHAVVARVTHTR